MKSLTLVVAAVVLAEVIDTMEKVVGCPIRRNHIEIAMGDARHTAADVSKRRKYWVTSLKSH